MSNRKKLKPLEPSNQTTGAVSVAFVHRNSVEYSFHHSLIQMLGWDAKHEMRVWRGGFVAERGTTGDMAGDRNRGVSDFLRDNRAEWMLWVDTDMGFEPDAIDRLVDAADPVQRPVMGGLCFAQREDESDGVGGFRPIAWPVLMDWTVVGQRGGFSVRWDYPRDELTQCHGVGSAFVLIHRTVFERVRERYAAASGNPEWAGWYSRIINPTTGELVGEDLSFCVRLMSAEIPVHVHTGIQTTHFKPVWLQEQDYWRQRALSPAPETVELIPREKWAAPRYAVVPTHNRPERLKALVASLGAQANWIIVLDNASDIPLHRWELAGAAVPATVDVLHDPEQPPHLSRFWNVLFDAVAKHATAAGFETWDVAVFNDDAVVPSGWFDVCQTVLRGHDSAVVAHTGTVPVHRHELVDAYPYPREKRMCPWAFVVRGEAGLRADESMRWWYFDDDFNRQAIDAGGVIAVPGPLVINADAVKSTVGVLEEQAGKDAVTFATKWGGTP